MKPCPNQICKENPKRRAAIEAHVEMMGLRTAHRLIEEFMLAANEAVAQSMQSIENRISQVQRELEAEGLGPADGADSSRNVSPEATK